MPVAAQSHDIIRPPLDKQQGPCPGDEPTASTRPSVSSLVSSWSSLNRRSKGDESMTATGSIRNTFDARCCEQDLVLPDTELIRDQVAAGGSSVTFLQVALSITARWQKDASSADQEAEVHFIRDCLNAGRGKTQMSCQLVTADSHAETETRRSLAQTYSSSGTSGTTTASADAPGKRRRLGSELRGFLRTVRDSPDLISSTPALPAGEGVPWMGPAVPTWPVEDVGSGLGSTAAKLTQLFDEQFNCWNFEVFELCRLSSGRPLLFAGFEAFSRSSAFIEFNMDWQKVSKFLQKAEGLYATDSQTVYHNNIHAADVTQTLHAFCSEVGIGQFYDPMDFLTSTLSAVIHDMGHDGRSNAFHVSLQDDLAVTYNDRSVLENYHLATAFKLLRSSDDCSMLAGLSADQQLVLRREVIDMVLGTDMSQHFQRTGDLVDTVERLGTDPAAWQADENAMYILRGMVLHAADISNPAKPFKIARHWSFRCLQEFFAQGDVEKARGLPVSPLCDRDATDVAGSQVGFIDFIVLPAYEAVARLVPRVHHVCLEHARDNCKAWQRRALDSDSYEDYLHAQGGLVDSNLTDFAVSQRMLLEPGAEEDGSYIKGKHTAESHFIECAEDDGAVEPPQTMQSEGLLKYLFGFTMCKVCVAAKPTAKSA